MAEWRGSTNIPLYSTNNRRICILRISNMKKKLISYFAAPKNCLLKRIGHRTFLFTTTPTQPKRKQFFYFLLRGYQFYTSKVLIWIWYNHISFVGYGVGKLFLALIVWMAAHKFGERLAFISLVNITAVMWCSLSINTHRWDKPILTW